MKTQKSFKTVGIVIALAALLGIVLFAIGQKDYGDLRMRSEQAVDAMNKEYAEDTYGGATPEETLQLFTDALKKGDTELASKYFLPEDQRSQLTRFNKIKNGGTLNVLINAIETRVIDNTEIDVVRYIIVNSEGLGSPLVLVKSLNENWKIRTL